MFETKFVSVDPDETPDGEDEDPEHIETKHLHDTVRQHTTRRARNLETEMSCHAGRTVFVGIWNRFCTSQNKLDPE